MSKEILENLKKTIESLEKELSKKPKTSEDYMKEISEAIKKINEKLSRLSADRNLGNLKDLLSPKYPSNPIPQRNPYQRPMPFEFVPNPVIPKNPDVNPYIITCNAHRKDESPAIIIDTIYY